MRVALWVTLTFERAGPTPSPVNECARSSKRSNAELEIAVVLGRLNPWPHDRDVSRRDRRQGRGLDEAGPMNRAVAGPETAEAEIRMLAADRSLPDVLDPHFEAQAGAGLRTPRRLRDREFERRILSAGRMGATDREPAHSVALNSRASAPVLSRKTSCSPSISAREKLPNIRRQAGSGLNGANLGLYVLSRP